MIGLYCDSYCTFVELGLLAMMFIAILTVTVFTKQLWTLYYMYIFKYSVQIYVKLSLLLLLLLLLLTITANGMVVFNIPWSRDHPDVSLRCLLFSVHCILDLIG